MATTKDKAIDDAEIRQLIDNWAKALRAKDTNELMSHSIGYEIRDLSITTGDDVAFSHSLNRISGTRTNGEETDVWVRATVGFRKIDGKWRVAHEHVSVPFHMD